MIRHFKLSIIFFSILLGVAAASPKPAAAQDSMEPYIRNVTIELLPGTRDQFLAQLERYADALGFAIRIVRVRPDRPSYSIQLWRFDIFGLGVNPEFDDTFEIGFYENRGPATVEIVDELIGYLKEALTEIPGATIVEVR